MAGFKMQGLDYAVSVFLGIGEELDKTTEKMLKAGGDALAKQHRKKLLSMGKKRTGTLANSIGRSEPKHSKGMHYVTVYPRGKQPHGTPGLGRGKKGPVTNAQVGFTMEYGSSKMPGTRWMEETNEQSENFIQAIMYRVWRDQQHD